MPTVLIRQDGKFLEAMLTENPDKRPRHPPDNYKLVPIEGAKRIDPRSLGSFGPVDIFIRSKDGEVTKTIVEKILSYAKSCGADYVLEPVSARCTARGGNEGTYHVVSELYVK